MEPVAIPSFEQWRIRATPMPPLHRARTAEAISVLWAGSLEVRPLQDYFQVSDEVRISAA